ncbi:MAG: hypothetical protein ABII74_01430 [Elusimicrobiota bacterium]
MRNKKLISLIVLVNLVILIGQDCLFALRPPDHKITLEVTKPNKKISEVLDDVEKITSMNFRNELAGEFLNDEKAIKLMAKILHLIGRDLKPAQLNFIAEIILIGFFNAEATKPLGAHVVLQKLIDRLNDSNYRLAFINLCLHNYKKLIPEIKISFSPDRLPAKIICPSSEHLEACIDLAMKMPKKEITIINLSGEVHPTIKKTCICS